DDLRPVPVGIRHFATVSRDEVLQAHWALVEHFKRSRDPVAPPGIKDDNLLESALSRQETSVAGVPKYRTLPHLAAALVYGLALNHPFHNGNKRTAFLSLLLLLEKNDYVLIANEAEAVDFIVAVASHSYRNDALEPGSRQTDEETLAIAQWISSHCRRIDQRLRPIDWRDLRKRLRHFGVTTRVLKGNFIELSLNGRRIILAYAGDTREVSKPTVRQIWRDLGIPESAAFDASAFYGSGAPVDRFILQFLDVFKRLAHR
ncbi:MAG TPA: type II toxin-antitoxin system death-on-curing family toxin, partial [Candidatus Sulfomarinibacteraceae bacterium]|nr:type II toxin-antitoxin system death-on-curing family toxin [Candidatus Sulfomarinibacteraceae bacterium]